MLMIMVSGEGRTSVRPYGENIRQYITDNPGKWGNNP
jgi:hypothetical protein